MPKLTEYLSRLPFQNVTQKPGSDIRLVTTGSCNSGCGFCHAEGHNSPANCDLNPVLSGWKDMKGPLRDKLWEPVDTNDIQNTVRVARALNLKKIHLTGGEPLLHPELGTHITHMRAAGLDVAMTTNGEVSERLLEQILNAGVSGVNFSVHALSPDRYVDLDLIAQRIRAEKGETAAFDYAKRRIELKLRNIQMAVTYSRTHNLKVATNTVVDDAKTAREVVDLSHSLGIIPRLQRNLNRKKNSGEQIVTLLNLLGVSPSRMDVAVGDSSGFGYYFDTSGGGLKVKDFGPVYIEPMCGGCTLKGAESCRERFYGVRLLGGGQVQTCIDWAHDGVTRFKIEDFLQRIDDSHTVPGAIREAYTSK